MKTPTKAQWAKWMVAGALPDGTRYWTICFGWKDPITPAYWCGTNFDLAYMAKGIIWRTQAEARAAMKRMLAAAKEGE